MRQRISFVGAVTVLLLVLFLLWQGFETKPLSALEKMAESIRKAKSCKHTEIAIVTYHSSDPKMPRTRKSTHINYWLAPGSTRDENISEDSYWEDNNTSIHPYGKSGVWINHFDKTYCRELAYQDNSPSTFDDLEFLGKFGNSADCDLGVKEINGRKALGFEIDMHKMESDCRYDSGTAEIWIDANSNLPIYVCYKIKRLHHDSIIEMTDIQWNIELDPKLFDTTPPANYADKTPKPLDLPVQISRITEALKIYADVNDGRYPDVKGINTCLCDDLCKKLGLSEWPAWDATEGKEGKAAKGRKGLDCILDIQTYSADYAFYGQTVTPDDKDKVLLRWKLDDGRYEVIYGDLRDETITAERLRTLEGK